MEMTSGVVRELLYYNPSTGIFTWRERGPHWFKNERLHKSWNSARAGSRAGCVKTNRCGYQYRQIGMLRKFYPEHRLAWLYMSDDPIPDVLDHVNRDALDNRWANIRASDFTRNMRNRSMTARSTSGVTGVNWHKKAGKWAVYCKLGDKTQYLGLFDDIDEATGVARGFRELHGFDPEHGLTPPIRRTP